MTGRYRMPGAPVPAEIKNKSYGAVKTALVHGKIKRASECGHCGSETAPLVAHHHDYALPLDVDWLCKPCHFRQHVFLANPKHHAKPWTGWNE